MVNARELNGMRIIRREQLNGDENPLRVFAGG